MLTRYGAICPDRAIVRFRTIAPSARFCTGGWNFFLDIKNVLMIRGRTMARYTGTFDPSEFVVVQDVFNRLTQHAWFRDDSSRVDWLGRFVINAYQGGITDNDSLYQHCLAASSSMADATSEIRIL
jgi:hypothetical protein